ncbi:hypothetical protein RchiOBHm_Chr7g0210581 [Rosa chinensis]|uniref:Uncharacterized protein n=1 Tax=Rosa chinensis TaxID=74649 RepID=A0A2P6PA98_ROSCH|nr:hypothetical protein RchiOBHm_Chr7g0210581 [Rosa chinensis]
MWCLSEVDRVPVIIFMLNHDPIWKQGLDGDPQRVLCQFRLIKLPKLEDDIGTLRLVVSKF